MVYQKTFVTASISGKILAELNANIKLVPNPRIRDALSIMITRGVRMSEAVRITNLGVNGPSSKPDP